MSNDDRELESLMAKRMSEMRSNISKNAEPAPKDDKSPPSAREMLVERLGHRGLEVLQNAEVQWPHETAKIIEGLAQVIRSGELPGTISGGDLLTLFTTLGVRVRMQTSIKVEKDGKLVSLSDKIGSA